MTVIDLRRARTDELGRLAMRAKVIDAYLKQDGTRVVRDGRIVSIHFASDIAAGWFEQVLEKESP